MFFYRAYALEIESEIVLPALEQSESPSPNLRIRKGDLRSPENRNQGEGGLLTRVDGVGLFLLRNGSEIVVDSDDGIEPFELQVTILGPVLSAVLRQRGLCVLHASCVAIDGAAVAFIGPSRAGKSTMAQACFSMGHPVIADDVTAIDDIGGTPHVLPAYPQLKLCEDSATSLVNDAHALPKIFGRRGKHLHHANTNFPRTPLPLKRIYVLQIGDELSVAPLAGREAVFRLLQNSRGIPPLTFSEYYKAQFEQCTELVRRVPIAKLFRRPSLAEVGDVVNRLEEDLIGDFASSEVSS